MGNRKRLAVFVGQADESYQSRFITGFTESAFRYDMDVCVFAMYHKYQNTEERERGESNIFSLMNEELFDGAVLLEDTIQTDGAADKLEKRLFDRFNKPVLVIEKESRYFPSILTDCHDAIVELVSHLIEEHNCTDVVFLSGKRWHKHAQERLRAVRDAMEQHGLELPDDKVVYGDFWYQSGELCADTLLADGKKLPDAVVCANDAMAIGLCKALDQQGVRIPEDIAVVSYDSTFEGQTSPKPITSSLIPAEEFGHYAADYMNDIFSGRETAPFTAEPYLVRGETCGCGRDKINIPEFKLIRDQWGTDISEEGFDSVNNTMAEDILKQTELADLIGTVYSYAFQIKGVKSFHLCLNDVWSGMGSVEDIRCSNNGYSEHMIYAVRYNSDNMDGIAGLDREFEVKQLLPCLESGDSPKALIFTPVFFGDFCYGYAAVDYGSVPRSYDDVYRRWIGLVSRGLESVRRYSEMQVLQEKLSQLQTGKFTAVNAAYDKLSEAERRDYDLVTKMLDGNLFTYHFQPIVNTIDGGIYSFEALMRSNTEKRVPPLSIIKYADMQGRLQDIEKATFMNVFDIVERELDKIGKAKIFINSIPGVRLEDEDFKKVELMLDKLSDTVVVELTEEAELGDDDLERLKDLFRRHNIKIAVDDYGTGYSNVSNLLRYMPNYVKIDRALLSDIQNKPQKRHFVKEIIGFCHDNAIMALAEGVETPDELRTVILLGADLIQGYYTARPSAGFVSSIDEGIRDEIRKYHKEYTEGGAEQRYIAGRTNRVSLASLVKDNVTEIVVGQGAMIYKDITVYGTPGVRTNVHIRVEQDYTGQITLENVCLSNIKTMPTIELGEKCDVTIVLVGENTLRNSGILVPDTSKLTVEGDGNLRIELFSSEYYGIGNLPAAATGDLVFSLSGLIDIKGSGVNGVCIGAGQGGRIRINSGRYRLDAGGHEALGIGVMSADAVVFIDACSIAAEFNAEQGAGIGSLTGSANLSVSRCSLDIRGDGTDIAGIGTISGKSCRLLMDASSADMKLSAVRSTGIGSLSGRTKLETLSTLLKIETSGEQALAMGGYNKEQQIVMRRSDARWTVSNMLGRDCFARGDGFRIVNGQSSFILNGEEVKRESVPE